MRWREQSCTISSRKALEILERQAGPMMGSDLDAARDFLLHCGRFEQGYLDAARARAAPLLSTAKLLTDCAAHAFLAIFKGDSAGQFRNRAAEALIDLQKAADFQLRLAVPHSLALGAVFPESVIPAAEQFTARHSRSTDRTWVILGDRVGGTGLTSLVRAVMFLAGMRAERGTVHFADHGRPGSLDVSCHQDAALVIVHDGHDPDTVLRLVQIAGTGLANICHITAAPLLSHSLAYKPLASAITDTETFGAPIEDPFWRDKRLQEAFAAESERLLGQACATMHDFSAGGWREMVWVDAKLWPPVMPWSPRKFLCRTASGKALLWKFAGLGSGADFSVSLLEEKWRRLTELAEKSWTVAPVAKKHGFIAVPWLQGQRLTSRDIDYPLLNQLANYVLNAALPPMPVAESTAQFEYLRELILQGPGDWLPDQKAITLTEFVRQAQPPVQLPTAGDMRLAPHKWIRTESGNVLKLDGAGHALDQTGLGPQSILWDLAGLIVEWDLPGSAQVQLQVQFANAQIPMTRENLAFYLLAYSAWKLACHEVSLQMLLDDPAELKRHRHAREQLRRQLERVAGALPRG